jgi:hypothetical protein
MDTELKMNRKVSALWKGTDWYPATIVKVGMCAEMHAFSMVKRLIQQCRVLDHISNDWVVYDTDQGTRGV